MAGCLGFKGGLGAAIACLVLCTGPAAGQAQRVFLFVDTDVADDSGDGSLELPYQKLNTALQRAYQIRYLQPVIPGEPVQVDTDVVIKVTAASTPIGPADFSTGVEDQGWRSWADILHGTTHLPFPIRMIKRVSIEGVRSGGQRPRVVIDEQGGSDPFGAAWGGLPIPQRSYFHAADNCSLSNLFLDGTAYFNKQTDRVNGVYGGNVSDFTISDCRVEDFYDGLYFFSDMPSQAPLPDPPTAKVSDSEILSAGPLHDPPDLLEGQGHAGAWLTGSGHLDVEFSHCLFEACHDGVEVAGTNMTSGVLALNACIFHNNENGVEAVGSGMLKTTIMSCMFDTNVNDVVNGGMQLIKDGLPNSPGAIAARNMTNNMSVRSSMFFNNAFGIIVGSNGTFDFGRSGLISPGHNTFDYDFSAFAGATDPIRVALYVGVTTATVMAGGNTWYHVNGNQGASATGCLTGPQTGLAGTGTNLYDAIQISTGMLFRVPPGPGGGVCCDPQGGDWKRNYSLQPNAVVQFGNSCLP